VLAGLVLLLSSLLSSGAAAHGGLPQTQDLYLHPSDPDTIVASATFGLLVSEDRGATWDWVCVQSIPGGRLGFVQPAVLTSDGTVLMATADGLMRGANLGCEPSFVPEFESRYMADIVRDPTDARTLYLLESEGTAMNRVYRSTDEGVSWDEYGVPLPMGFLPERIRVTSDGYLYTGGTFPPTPETERRARVFVSNDAAMSWTEVTIAIEMDERNLFLLEAHDPGLVYAHIPGDLRDRFIVSTDHGMTFGDFDSIPAAMTVTGRPIGFARTASGVYYGNTERGLFHSPDGMPGVEIDTDVDTACLKAVGTDLYMCANGLVDGYSIGRASLPALTFEPLLEFADIAGPRACGGEVEATCDMWWDDLLRDVGRGSEIPDGGFVADGGRDGGSGPIDAAGLDAGTTIDDDGGCCQASPGASATSALFIAVVALLAIRRQRS
jgi:hypothetical protein